MKKYIATAHQIINGQRIPFKSVKVSGIDKAHAIAIASIELGMHHSLIKIKAI